MEKKKYLFVDIDGCMTSVADGNHYMCNNLKTYGKCERTVELIKSIVERTGCKIVISSNWRRFPEDGFYVFEEMRCYNPLPTIRKQLGSIIEGDLPHDRHLSKSDALELWFEDNNLNHDDISFAIIDDDLREGFTYNPNFSGHFFLCDYNFGLTDGIAYSIVELLNK